MHFSQSSYKIFLGIALFTAGVQSAPTTGGGTFDLTQYEKQLDNPSGQPTVWVLDCPQEPCDITKGTLYIIGEYHSGPTTTTTGGPAPTTTSTGGPTPSNEPQPYIKRELIAMEARAALEAKGISEICSSAHQAASSVCRSIISGLQAANLSITSGQTRSFCFTGQGGQCCISWSANASFSSTTLANDAAGCYNVCASANVSCQARGVTLGGRVLDVCLSNRPNGCT